MNNQNIKMKLSEYVTLFNEQLQEFIDQLNNIINHLNDEKTLSISSTYNNCIKAALYMKQDTCIEAYSGYILKPENKDFTTKIAERDLNYFNNIQFENQASNNLLDLIKIIRNVVPQLKNEDQEKIFGYLENLCTLSNLYALEKISS